MLADPAISSDGKVLASSFKNETKIWSLTTGQFLHAIPTGFQSISISSDNQVLIGNFKGETQIYSLNTGKLLRKLQIGFNSIGLGAFSQVFIGNSERIAWVGDLRTGEIFRTFCIKEDIFNSVNVNITLNGQILASRIEQNSTIKIWRLNAENLPQSYSKHPGDAWSLDFAIDSQKLPFVRATPEIRPVVLSLTSPPQLENGVPLETSNIPVQPSADQNAKAEADRLNKSGIYSMYLDGWQINNAISIFLDVLVIYGEINNISGEGEAFNNLGAAFERTGSYLSALKFYQQALSKAQRVGDRIGQGRVFNNIGVIYLKLEQPRKALEFLIERY